MLVVLIGFLISSNRPGFVATCCNQYYYYHCYHIDSMDRKNLITIIW